MFTLNRSNVKSYCIITFITIGLFISSCHPDKNNVTDYKKPEKDTIPKKEKENAPKFVAFRIEKDTMKGCLNYKKGEPYFVFKFSNKHITEENSEFDLVAYDIKAKNKKATIFDLQRFDSGAALIPHNNIQYILGNNYLLMDSIRIYIKGLQDTSKIAFFSLTPQLCNDLPEHIVYKFEARGSDNHPLPTIPHPVIYSLITQPCPPYVCKYR